MSSLPRSWSTICSLHRISNRRSISTTSRRLETEKKTDKVVVAPTVSSCASNTILQGLAYLKDQPPVTALPDEEYPPWLWTILSPKVWPEDGPGGKAEKVQLRKENRQKIRDQNFMKTQ